jgi:uroporphyrin-III C-methyltransferase
VSQTQNKSTQDPTLGTVYLVGAGPGDPDLLTLKAARLLAEAEAVVYDRLVSSDVLEMINEKAERVYAGKGRNRHSMRQERINDTLLELAQKHKLVVRLKGGDPFIFGRGGEEADHLVRHGVSVEVVPGITSAAGAGAGLGLPLTHRGLATSVRYVTGTCRKGEELDLNWQSLADPDTTLIVYMGLANLGAISENLIKAGLSADTPAAAIENATTKSERLCVASLSSLNAAIIAQDFQAPTLIVIGRVVEMVDQLKIAVGKYVPVFEENAKNAVEA